MKKEKLTKVISILTIITTIITLASALFSFIIPMYLVYKLQIDASNAYSIGVIGDANGPTAIYLASQPSSHLITVIFALLTIAGIAFQIYVKKTTK